MIRFVPELPSLAATMIEDAPGEPPDVSGEASPVERRLVEVLERYAPEYVARVRADAAETDEVIGFGEPDERGA